MNTRTLDAEVPPGAPGRPAVPSITDLLQTLEQEISAVGTELGAFEEIFKPILRPQEDNPKRTPTIDCESPVANQLALCVERLAEIKQQLVRIASRSTLG
jgi:hypothetical protein